jgi:uncharacterized protein with von Willebrand factor type A (vWA) domain
MSGEAGPFPSPVGTEETPHRLAVAFVTTVRAAGLDVPTDSTVTYTRALAAVGPSSTMRVYWAGRTTLVRRPEDVPAYDAVFSAFFGAVPFPSSSLAPPHPTDGAAAKGSNADQPRADAVMPSETGSSVVVPLRFSRDEALRRKDFAHCTASEMDEAQQLMAMIRLGGATRRSSRRHRARRGDRPDMRGTVRRAMRTSGEPLQRRWLARTEQPRRVVLLCDVSGSMAPYARALLRFLHVAVVGRQRVEAFTIGTRLTRVTRALRGRDPDSALAGVADAVQDWSSGTRLGEALREFNDRFGLPGLARGAVVVILSDGWDLGDPALLGAEMARLARVAHRVVWANPLKATPDYEPLARGMAAALPHVDDFIEGHSVASLEALAELVKGTRPATQAGVAR